ncbi:Cof-type HAD-IIB family hydrolase [Caldanaerobius polysaccharolyticus]|uniref:Cof-type HAD-IIB family hydrolase n=1 Tax=Caldanaerobius polysaccharolyticus TaxID=44256 RepID=UPI00047B9663|nr:Cof-type HAD-IIB family hydrolase [Caldanaerobius polysaccharolyticus]
MRYKMVIADIDGTLVDDNRMITPVTKKAVMEFREKGGIFTIATGRGIDSASPFIQELHIDVPVILFNGCMIYHPQTGKIMYSEFLPPDVYKIAAKLWKTKDYPVEMLAFSIHGIYVYKITELIRLFMDIDHVYCREVENIEDVKDIVKVLFLGDAEVSKELVKRLGNYTDNFTCVQSDRLFIELLPQGVTKGSTLIKLCRILGIDLKEVVAIGDQDNDREMICNAGCGVAMGNADDDLKACAKYVTSTNMENGVAEVLQRVIRGDLFTNCR